MSLPELVLVYLSLFLLTSTVQFCNADVGTASQYQPPYLPTACFGNDPSKFPINNLFAAAGEGIWDNGASCGRKYFMRCISGPTQGSCVTPLQTIEVVIVDRALTAKSRPSRDGASLVLSNTAYQTIANPNVNFVNIEFIQR